MACGWDPSTRRRCPTSIPVSSERREPGRQLCFCACWPSVRGGTRGARAGGARHARTRVCCRFGCREAAGPGGDSTGPAASPGSEEATPGRGGVGCLCFQVWCTRARTGSRVAVLESWRPGALGPGALWRLLTPNRLLALPCQPCALTDSHPVLSCPVPSRPIPSHPIPSRGPVE